LFQSENQTLGQQVALSRVNEVIESLPGVDYLDVIQMQRIPNPYLLPFNSGTDLTIGSFIVGAETVADSYTVYMLSATAFEVRGDGSGNQGSGTVGTQFASSDGTFSFTATAGSSPATSVDKFRFKAGTYTSNINPESDEMVKLKDNSFQLTVLGGVG